MVLAFVELTVDEISESCVSCSHDQAVQAAADAGAVSVSHQCGSNIVHTSRCSASPTPYTTLGNTLMVDVEAVASIMRTNKMIMCSTREGTLAS